MRCRRLAGPPWLDRFPDATVVLDEFNRVGPIEIGTRPAGALDIADLCRARGDATRERGILEAYVAKPVLQSHIKYLRGYLSQHGHGDLAELITATAT
jgi:hypothetical protein